MIDSLLIGLSGIQSSLFKQRVSSENLANVSTNGYKAGQAQTSVSENGEVSATVSLSQQQGAFIPTTGRLQVTIDGNGFFRVMLDDEYSYTRSGAFVVNNEGMLSTAQGYSLSPSIQVSGGIDSISIASDGTVYGINAESGVIDELGTLQLFEFADPSKLQQIGGGLFKATEASGSATAGKAGSGGLGTILPGGLEASNVDLATEMVDQTLAQRGVEANVKTIQTADEILGTVMDLIG